MNRVIIKVGGPNYYLYFLGYKQLWGTVFLCTLDGNPMLSLTAIPEDKILTFGSVSAIEILRSDVMLLVYKTFYKEIETGIDVQMKYENFESYIVDIVDECNRKAGQEVMSDG